MNKEYLKAMAERRNENELVEELDFVELPCRANNPLKPFNMGRFQPVSPYERLISTVGETL